MRSPGGIRVDPCVTSMWVQAPFLPVGVFVLECERSPGFIDGETGLETDTN